jgi:sarcosine oxidase subunit beta
MMLAHNVHDVQVFQRHIHANRLNGVDNEWLTPEEAKEFCPPLNIASRRGIRWWALPCSARRHRPP